MAETDRRFKVRRHEGLTALNYIYVTGDPDQFRWPMSEMRGLMVDEHANTVVARPFQKFWNIWEKDAAGTDWSERHVVLPKFDGSLVYPAGYRWVTRGGVTDTSLRVERIAESIGEPLRALLDTYRTDDDGTPCTPLFEYVGPSNQIVLRYDYDRLVLLAVRRITDGKYWSTEKIQSKWKIGPPGLDLARPITGMEAVGGTEGAKRLADTVAGWPSSREGVVVAFEPSGHRVKIKGKEYIALHRARDEYSTECHVLKAWAMGRRDQLELNLTPVRAKRLAAYYDKIEECVSVTAITVADVAGECWHRSDGNRKTAAASWIAKTEKSPMLRPLGFRAFDALAAGEDPEGKVLVNINAIIERASGKQKLIDTKVRPMLGSRMPVWNPPDGNFADAES